MSELIRAIKETRLSAVKIATNIVKDIDGKSEVEVRDLILKEMANNPEMYPMGWYDPPLGGVGVLFDTVPFTRLQFESLRLPEYFPRDNFTFEKESVGMIYLSPVNKSTNMIGDFGFTLYKGEDEATKDHIRVCYETILDIAKHAEVGMDFEELCNYAKDTFEQKNKTKNWIKLFHHPLSENSINIGHTVPGSFEKDLDFGNNFEEIRENIRTKRIYINSGERFVIPETCAFTIEARLADRENENLPNTFFHFIVTFENGKKEILNNFDFLNL
ncbi:MAG TPA: hypothetical protein VFQ59_02615 [Candidatus Paceibacterota bacterium]|nr:hypothetical protein [Candidatus Paceibacterota bacterium]